MKTTWLLWIVVSLANITQGGDLTVAGLFKDGAILQRDKPIVIWGWGVENNHSVEVSFREETKTSLADYHGHWQVTLPPQPASSEAMALNILSEDGDSIIVKDILVGEVWLCSGQSNMAMIVDRAKDPEKEKAASSSPNLRVFTVTRNAAEEPQKNCAGEWVASSPETVGRFSATAYFYGRELHKKLDVPVGLIVSAWSGSAIEAWTSREVQENEPSLANLRASWAVKDTQYTPAIETAGKAKYEKEYSGFKTALKAAKGAGTERPRAPRRPINPRFHHHHPDVLYNGMIAPLIPYCIRGAIWYQGETNGFTEESSALYETQLRLMVNDWRKRWGQGNFPMAWIQLPFTSANRVAWPRIRESMRRVSENLPNTGMAVTIDLGEERILHPKNKQAFSQRLALWARAEVYGEPIDWSGPAPQKPKVEGGSVTIKFNHCADGLTIKDGALKGFELLGNTWKKAKANLEGNSVSISAPDIASPKAVRYAWANRPDGNLYNSEGLPATPFELILPQVKNGETRLEPTDIVDGFEQVEIYLLMGQSNMKGRGAIPNEPARTPQIIMMHKPSDKWFLAQHPLHLTGDPTDFTGADNAGVGPGLAFAETIAKTKIDHRIALIPTAAGGTAIAKWKKGAKLYEDAIRKARLAMDQGPTGKTRIAGVLWLQGESDSNSPEKIAAYPEALTRLVDNIRSDLKIPELPFIAATIGEMRTDIEARKKINAILLDLPNQRPRCGCVDARDLDGHIGDLVHFDTNSQNAIGERFAKKLLELE